LLLGARHVDEPGLFAHKTAWGIMIDFSKIPAWFQTESESMFGIPQLGYFAKQAGAHFIILSDDGPIVDGLPLFGEHDEQLEASAIG